MRDRLLRYLSRNVFGAVLLGDRESLPAIERYLEDLWREAPKFAVLSQVLLALFVSILPLFHWKYLCPFPLLSLKKKARFLELMADSPLYFVRLCVNSLRGIALVAAFRDPAVRLGLLGRE